MPATKIPTATAFVRCRAIRASRLRFRYSFPSDQNAEGPRFFETLRDMWKQAGIEFKLQAMEADALTAICCPAFDFDVILWGWGAGV